MNRRRLIEAKKRLQTVVDPKRFYMRCFQKKAKAEEDGGFFSSHVEPNTSLNLLKHTCGTAGCFAGWLPTMFPHNKLRSYESWSEMVEGFFDLDCIQADYLWGPGCYYTKSGRCRKDIKVSHVIEHIDDLLEGRIN